MKSTKPISCSELGMAAKCPHTLMHKYAGTPESGACEQRKRKGTIAHEKFTVDLEQAADKRCYIASSLYGYDSPETQRLRQFRDNVLMRCALGRVVVRFYYTHSPKWVATGLVHRSVNRIFAILIRLPLLCLSGLDAIHAYKKRRASQQECDK